MKNAASKYREDLKYFRLEKDNLLPYAVTTLQKKRIAEGRRVTQIMDTK